MRKQLFAVIFAAVFAVGCSSNDNGTSTSGSSGSNGASGSSGSTSTSTSGSGGSTSGSGSSGSTSTSGSGGSTSGSGSSGGSSGASGPDWTCLGSETPPTAGATASVTLTLTDALGGAALTGETVKLCDVSDTACATPVGSGSVVTGNDGTATISNVALNNAPFTGFADVTGSDIPETFIYLPPFGADVNQAVSVITSTDIAGAVALHLYGTVDTANHGFISGSISDCAGAAASGVAIAASPVDSSAGSTTTVFYVQNGQQVQGATSTTASGQYVITNVPPAANGDEVVTATNSDGDPVGSYSVVVKAGAVTTIIGTPNQ